jgi:hypothetical protein
MYFNVLTKKSGLMIPDIRSLCICESTTNLALMAVMPFNDNTTKHIRVLTLAFKESNDRAVLIQYLFDLQPRL